VVQNSASLQVLRAEAFDTNPEIHALRHQVSSRLMTLQFEQAGNKPLVNLSGNYSVQGQWSDDFLPPSEQQFSSSAVAFGVQIPVFDGFMTRSRSDRAKANLRISELELHRGIRAKDLEIGQAWLSLENALAALDGRTEAVKLAQETHRLAIVRQQNGMATPLELLDAELAMITAEGQLAIALHVCNMAHAALEFAVGINLDDIPALTVETELDNESHE